jgi:hypothetical protein
MWCDGPMLELLSLGVAGMFVGAALSARKRAAPLPLIIVFLVMAAMCLLIAIRTFQTPT